MPRLKRITFLCYCRIKQNNSSISCSCNTYLENIFSEFWIPRFLHNRFSSNMVSTKSGGKARHRSRGLRVAAPMTRVKEFGVVPSPVEGWRHSDLHVHESRPSSPCVSDTSPIVLVIWLDDPRFSILLARLSPLFYFQPSTSISRLPTRVWTSQATINKSHKTVHCPGRDSVGIDCLISILKA